MHKDPIHYNMDHMKFRHQELGKIPLSVPSDRDPWLMPVMIFAGVVLVYFVWQFSR